MELPFTQKPRIVLKYVVIIDEWRTRIFKDDDNLLRVALAEV
jgi:hypothetical protein